ncbi:MAG: DUF6498-containing protein [Betaproteobacteria bacterium]
MDLFKSPLAIAQTVARNIVPVVGILVYGWPAATILVLYFADTLLAMVVIFAGLMRYSLPPSVGEGWAARANAEVGYVGAALLIVAILAIPLGVALVFMLAPGNVDWRAMLADETFRIGMVMQAIAALWSGAGLYRALQTYTPEQLQMRRRFTLVFLRWMVLLVATYSGIFALLGHYSAFFFVVVYVATTMTIEIAPDQFLHAMFGGEEDADKSAGESIGEASASRHASREAEASPTGSPTSPRTKATPVAGRRRHKRH